MRPSPLRHPVAALRAVLEMSQSEFAAIIGCARRTIQAIELGQLALSADIANHIVSATGVMPGCLLVGPENPYGGEPGRWFLTPARSVGLIYRRKDFEAAQAAVHIANAERFGIGGEDHLTYLRVRFATMLETAHRSGVGALYYFKAIRIISRWEGEIRRTARKEKSAVKSKKPAARARRKSHKP